MLVPRRLYRAVGGRVLAGVAQGLAEHLRVPAIAVRVAFAALCVLNGFGAVLYLALWVVLPAETLDPAAPADACRTPGRMRSRGQAVALVALTAGVLILLRSSSVLSGGPWVVPVVLAGAGLGLMWRQADETQRARWLRMSTSRWVPGERRGVAALHIGGGVVLVGTGIAAFLFLSGQWTAARDGLVGGLAVLVGLALITGPWWWRLVADLSEERRERIRSQERAELAAHLHDSVLQTLALIQRHVDAPREVARLARGQERELRSWLYGARGRSGPRLAAAFEVIAGEVEDAYAVRVETVVVGDADVDPRLDAVVQGTREALVNAAKHAAVDTVSLYAEVEPDRVTVFVRDRGVGFDAGSVPDHRHGVRGSIVGRMERHGGSAAVRSSPGSGTEVELRMQRESL